MYVPSRFRPEVCERLTFEQRITQLERADGSTVPGTQLARTAGPEYNWCLALGMLHMPKKMFYGSSIADCLFQAEAWVRDWMVEANKEEGRNRGIRIQTSR